jgi:ABC-2 type transport system permease protein
MLKLVKYELRSNLFVILGIFITLIIANLLLLTRINSWGTELVLGSSAFLFLVTIIIIFIFSLNIMSKYLHNDSGYLLLTLPQSGTSIIISRLITGLIQIAIVISVSLFFFHFISSGNMSFEILKNLKFYGINLIIYTYGTVYLLTFIYFCMILGKVAFRNKKIGKVGSFVVFVLLSLLLGWISQKLQTLFPQAMDFSNLLTSTTIELKFNIASSIFEICTLAIFFISGSYLLDKKVDL